MSGALLACRHPVVITGEKLFFVVPIYKSLIGEKYLEMLRK